MEIVLIVGVVLVALMALRKPVAVTTYGPDTATPALQQPVIPVTKADASGVTAITLSRPARPSRPVAADVVTVPDYVASVDPVVASTAQITSSTGTGITNPPIAGDSSLGYEHTPPMLISLGRPAMPTL